MHASETNRSKLAITERLMKRVDWKGKSVLEYGCGGGYFTVWMAKQGAQVTAIEMSPCAIGAVNYYAAQEGVADRVRVVPGNAETDTVDGQYDFIFAKDLVEHLEDDGPFFRTARAAAQARRQDLHRDPERSLTELPAGRRLRAHLPSQQALVRLGPDSQALLQCAHARRPHAGGGHRARVMGIELSRPVALRQQTADRQGAALEGMGATRPRGRHHSSRSPGWGGRSWSSEGKTALAGC